MAPFTPSAYGTAVVSILGDGTRLMPLGPGTLHPDAKSLLERFDPSVDLGISIRDRDMARCCHAMLWLYHDGIDPAHEISQDITTPTGSYIHGIVHRREPDASNSKYWLARIGSHPLPGQLRVHAAPAGLTFITPEAFVDRCEQVRGKGGIEEEQAQRIQLLEWQLLFEYCFTAAK